MATPFCAGPANIKQEPVAARKLALSCMDARQNKFEVELFIRPSSTGKALFGILVLSRTPYLALPQPLKKSNSASFEVEVRPDLAPLAALRFKELVDAKFFKGVRFFRVIEGFMAQFGISGKPDIAAQWRERKMVDDPVKGSNTRGWLSFATSGKDSRTTQMFINFVDNTNLDGMGFAPFAQVKGSGMKVVDKIFSGYGEGAPSGNGPEQGRIQSEGNKYLKKDFPRLTWIKSATLVDADGKEL